MFYIGVLCCAFLGLLPAFNLLSQEATSYNCGTFKIREVSEEFRLVNDLIDEGMKPVKLIELLCIFLLIFCQKLYCSVAHIKKGRV